MVAASSPLIGNAGLQPKVVDRRVRARRMIWLQLVLLLGMSALSLAHGATGVSPFEVMTRFIRGEDIALADRIVLFDIRLPRLILGVLVGAALAVSGALMQGLFRNPLADPGLVGISAGAGMGAIVAIVLGGLAPIALTRLVGYYLVPLAAALGGWAAMYVLYRVATRRGRTSVATMLLAGIALAALTGALSGILIYKASDAQLRDLTFWGMGSLAGATWTKVLTALPIICAALAVSPFVSRGLNGLALGEAAASHLGINIQRVKSAAILSVTGATGAAVAVSGGIGFIGLVVPHMLRLAIGPDHRFLIPNAALLGATLLLAADAISRTLIQPAELPIGIVTAIMGAPVFLWILLRNRGLLDM